MLGLTLGLRFYGLGFRVLGFGLGLVFGIKLGLGFRLALGFRQRVRVKVVQIRV